METTNPPTERRAVPPPKPFIKTSTFWLNVIVFLLGPPLLWVLWTVLNQLPIPPDERAKYLLQAIQAWLGLVGLVAAPTVLGRSLVSVMKLILSSDAVKKERL